MTNRHIETLEVKGWKYSDNVKPANISEWFLNSFPPGVNLREDFLTKKVVGTPFALYLIEVQHEGVYVIRTNNEIPELWYFDGDVIEMCIRAEEECYTYNPNRN